jgi:hypothetical protein
VRVTRSVAVVGPANRNPIYGLTLSGVSNPSLGAGGSETRVPIDGLTPAFLGFPCSSPNDAVGACRTHMRRGRQKGGLEALFRERRAIHRAVLGTHIAAREFSLVLVLLVFLLSAKASCQPVGCFRGTLEVEYLGPKKTNSFDFELLSHPPDWKLALANSGTDTSIELLGRPRETIWMTVYHNHSPAGPLNAAEIKLLPGSRPFDLREEEHVWLAFLSATTFREQKLPLLDPGLCMAEPSIISVINLERDDASPREMRWHNQGVDAPGSSRSRIEGRFRWLVHTNLPGGMIVPMNSELEISILDALGVSKAITRTKLIVTEAGPLPSKRLRMPSVQGRCCVSDYRLGTLWDREAVNYEVKDARIPIPTSYIVEVAYRAKFPSRTFKHAPSFFWVSIAALTVSGPPLFWFIKKKLATRQTTNSVREDKT